jgi:hypothetical protein
MPARSGNARQRVYWHGRSGYVLAAPSRHVGGGATQWLRPLDTPVPDAPPRAFTAMAGAWVQPA